MVGDLWLEANLSWLAARVHFTNAGRETASDMKKTRYIFERGGELTGNEGERDGECNKGPQLDLNKGHRNYKRDFILTEQAI